MGGRRTATAAVGATISLLALAIAGCIEGDLGRPVGGSCSRDEDCAPGLLCRLGRCRTECLFDRDCPDGTVCVTPAESPGLRVCTLPDEGGCGDLACPEGLACGDDGLCREACGDGVLCPPPRECDLGVCVDPGEPAWTAHEGVTEADLYAVTGADDGRIFAVGAEATIVVYDGTEWAPLEPAYPEAPILFRDGHWSEHDQVLFLVSDAGQTPHYQRGTWFLRSTGLEEDMWSIWGCT